jgi:hypothetical protein
VVYVYAALVTLGATAMVVVYPVWRRGGWSAVTENTPWLIRFFVGLLVLMLGLSVILSLLDRP